MEIMAKVIKIDSDIYILEDKNNGNIISAKARGNLKKKESIVVGDNVIVQKIENDYMIISVEKRDNFLIRPPVSNISKLVIVVSASNPSPDYILLDKQIILAYSKNIIPVICVNKIDLEKDNKEVEKEINYIEKTYSSLGIKVIKVSAKDGTNLDLLKEELKQNTSAFSGNSGVGKSSITSMLTSKNSIEIGEVGKKTKRGKHTTKSVNLYMLEKDTYILDTPGFSSYELFGIEPKDLKNYYVEFKDFKCDFDDCNHILESEKVCAVKRAVNELKIDKGRYERYKYIYEKIKEMYDNRYK